ncbi:MAG: hypothetical protein ACO36I_01910 [Candidatus Latescibacterota bacterium]
MVPDVVHFSGEHKHVIRQLCELIPDFDPEIPENLQRIFGLGLFALLMQVTSKPLGPEKLELRCELVNAAKEMVDGTDV